MRSLNTATVRVGLATATRGSLHAANEGSGPPKINIIFTNKNKHCVLHLPMQRLLSKYTQLGPWAEAGMQGEAGVLSLRCFWSHWEAAVQAATEGLQ